MPIYEFACPQCRVIFSFLSRRIRPERSPSCPKCGQKDLRKQISGFALLRGGQGTDDAAGEEPMPDLDNPRIGQAMAEIEREMGDLDEHNPRHMAHVMKKMKAVLPPGPLTKDLDVVIKRLEAGESPEKIEEDMGDVLGEALGGAGAGGGAGSGGYARDPELHEY